MKKKTIEPLKELRQIREKLSVRYWNDPEKLKNDMGLIRKKYNLKKSVSGLKEN